mgnify:CR=1 FL=1
MIKYRCPHCSQKLGVPDEYAGHRVRCSKCGERSMVPQKILPVAEPVSTVSENVPVAVVVKSAGVSPRPDRQQGELETLSRPSEVSQSQPAQSHTSTSLTTPQDMPEMTAEDEFPEVVEEDPNAAVLRQVRTSRARKLDLKIPSGRKSGIRGRKSGDSGPDSSDRGGFSLDGLLPDFLRTPLGFLLAFGLVGGLIWTWVIMARASDSSMNFFAALIPLAGAAGLRLIPGRGVAVGFLAVVLGLVGIGAGKAAMTRWGMIPMLERQAEEEVLENIAVTMNNKNLQLPADKSAKFILRTPGAMSCVALAYLVHQENADPHEARMLALDLLRTSGGDKGFTEAVSNIGAFDASEETRQIALYERLEGNELYGKVTGLLWTWEDGDAIRMARTYYPVYSRLAYQARLQRQFSSGEDPFEMAFMASLSAMDIIWFALGIGGAFVVSTFE